MAASRELKVIVGFDGSRLSSGVRQAGREIGGFASDLKESFGRAQATFDHFSNNVQTVVNLVKTGFEQISEGARRIEMREAFEEQLGGSAQAARDFLDTLDAAAGGTISDMDLMASASKAMSLQVTTDADEMASLLEIARFKARKFGTDTATAFEDISVGVGRQSKLILDNLGIVVDTEQAYADYAAALGTTADKLDDAQKKQAFLNSVLAAGQDEIAAAGGLVDSQADKLRIMQVEWDKAIAKAQEYIALSAGRAIGDPTGGANAVIGTFDFLSQTDIKTDALLAATDALNETYQATGNLNDIWTLLRINFGTTIDDVAGIREALAGNNEALAAYNQVLIDNAAAYGLTREQAIALTGITAEHTAAVYNEVAALFSGSAIMYGYGSATIEAARALDAATFSSSDLQAMQAALVDEVAATTGALYRAEAGGYAFATAADVAAAAAARNAAEVWGLKDALDQLNNARTGNYGMNAIPYRPRISPRQFQEDRANEYLRNSGADEYFRALEAWEIRRANYLNSMFEEMNNVHWDWDSGWVSNEIPRGGGGGGAGGARTAARTAAREHEKAAEDIRRAYEKAFNEIEGYVGQALTFNATVGQHDALLDQFGLRNQNASDELMRRLADVRDRALEGTRSPWLDMFPELDAPTMEEIAARAEAMMRRLKEGLRYDLLDKEAVKADIRELIAADRAADEWKRQIATELMAEGAGTSAEIQNALTQQMGVASTGAGETASVELVDSMTTGLMDAVNASATEFTNIGAQMGDYLIDGLETRFKKIAEELVVVFFNSMAEAA